MFRLITSQLIDSGACRQVDIRRAFGVSKSSVIRSLNKLRLLLLLAFMALCRIKTTEKLQGHAPGEFGKLLGLDRAPEVRCLRQKMDELSADQGSERWAAHLSKYWMQQEPESVGALSTSDRLGPGNRP